MLNKIYGTPFVDTLLPTKIRNYYKYKMEELVEKYINSNASGVKIVEMEETLQQSRLRLGYVTRKLLNEGRVQKIDNRYYPINENQFQKKF